MELYHSLKKNYVQEYPNLIDKAIQLITENYYKIYGIEDIAVKIGVSKFYLIRLFSRTLGITLAKYITKVRLQKSVELLHNTNLNIDEIAKTIGYASQWKSFHKSI
ncbi:helix-turn-helix transcriptional regulator [Clostridium lacusfryxellense]|uniref:helix-turn-helix transcriptional regulator n=1 Tax=Clostridium lacusfryxellense TaxID=205328 RepID=UPI001C0BC896|nr:AraC family transcriptional regulator [Clostridium lacusfryxellense]MBU3113293.1 AraC family transcriptional regulator [Clostridium lacusfryxellense]